MAVIWYRMHTVIRGTTIEHHTTAEKRAMCAGHNSGTTDMTAKFMPILNISYVFYTNLRLKMLRPKTNSYRVFF